MTNLIANIFTITVLSYWAGCWAYSFGWFLGWVMDPREWPRMFTGMLVDLYRWDRQVSKLVCSAEEWQASFDWKFVDGGRAPRGTP